jgi:hypothetical protein
MDDAIHFNVPPPKNDGQAPYAITVQDVRVDASWSITLYNKAGMFGAPESSIPVNSVTAKKNADGSTTVHFGGDRSAAWRDLPETGRPRHSAQGRTQEGPVADAGLSALLVASRAVNQNLAFETQAAGLHPGEIQDAVEEAQQLATGSVDLVNPIGLCPRDAASANLPQDKGRQAPTR